MSDRFLPSSGPAIRRPIVRLAWRGLIPFLFLAAFKGWSNGHGHALLVTGLVHSCFSLVVRRLPCPSPVMLVADWLSISQASLSFGLVFNYTCDPALCLFLGLFVVDPYSAWFHFSLFVVSLVTITVTFLPFFFLFSAPGENKWCKCKENILYIKKINSI